MTTIVNCYRNLIVDVSHISKVQLCAPCDLDTAWILVGGPALDKAILRHLENGAEIPTIPDWLTPLWAKFRLNDDPCLLKCLRQLCCFGYKIRYEPTKRQLETAQADFEDTDRSIAVYDSAFNSCLQKTVTFRSARSIVAKVIYRIDWRQILPSHGPGSVFPSYDHVSRSSFDVICPQLESTYPYFEYFCGLPNYWVEQHQRLEAVDESSRAYHARLTAVPKDSRGPRLICVHPRELIWIQQGQRAVLEQAINRNCRPFISLNDQTVNGKLALESSLTQEYTTLDLKEASDRLSCSVVKYLFGGAYPFLECSRAKTIRLMDDRVITLNKFAPMGNCNIFPIQSLVFWALVRAGIGAKYGDHHANVYVFGDDILFPTKYYEGALQALIGAGLKPNIDKTFKSGFFRESCGVDAYRGKDVTPIRIKRWDIVSYSDCSSLCSLAKSLRINGYEETSAYIYKRVREHVRSLPLSNNPLAQGIFEYVCMDLGRFMQWGFPLRWNHSLHRYETQMLLPRSRIAEAGSDWYHLQDSLLNLLRREGSSDSSKIRAGETPRGDVSHLRSGTGRGLEYTVPYSERFVKGWTALSQNGQS